MFEWYDAPAQAPSGYDLERARVTKMKDNLRQRQKLKRRLRLLRLVLGRSGLGWAGIDRTG